MSTVRRTICNRDCPDSCAILATVENGAVTKLAGDPEHPVTNGFLCYRTNQFLDRQYSPERLKEPLLRVDGELVPVSWDRALDFIAERLVAFRAESGGASIFHYQSGGSLGLLKALSAHFFQQFGPVTVKRGDICSGAGEAAQVLDFGISDSSDLFDLENAKHIVLWGKNVVVSSPHTVPVLKRAVAKGAKLTLIDPIHTASQKLCSTYVQPRPGGDFALAMGCALVVFEEGWLAADASSYCDNLAEFRELACSTDLAEWARLADVTEREIVQLAEAIACGGPTTILVGWGMGRRKNGGTIVRAIDALAAITGNIGVPGAGVSFYFQRRSGLDRPFDVGADVAARTIPEPLFGQGVLGADDPPVRALWVTAGNPVAMLPDSESVARAIASRELVVVVDSFLTDTGRLATVVLPTTTLLEDSDIVGAYGHHYVGASKAVVPPPAGVRTDLEIIQSLASRVGLSGAVAGTAREWQERMTATLRASGVTLEDLETTAVRKPNAPRVLFEQRQFPTESGRVNLMTAAEAPTPARPNRQFPLLLAALSTRKAQCSQWAKQPAGPLEVTVHPDAAVGILDGGLARLESTVGSLPVLVRHDPNQRRDTAMMAKGGHHHLDQCANVLVEAQLTDLGEGGSLYDQPVRLVPS